MPFELFHDPSYYDMWAVRDVSERSFDRAIHVHTLEEAQFLKERLNIAEQKLDSTQHTQAQNADAHRASGE